MSKEIIQSEDMLDEDYETPPLKRIIGHHLFDSYSFLNLPKFYLISVPIIVLLLLMSLRLGIFALLINKSVFVPYAEGQIMDLKESYYVGILISAIPQILVWAVLVYGLMLLMGGKGKFLHSVSIYTIAQIPIVLGLIVLLFVALAQPSVTIPSSAIEIELFSNFNSAFFGYNLSFNIIYPITSLYSSIIAGVGLSTEHKIPALMGIIVGIMAFIASMIFAYLI